MITSIYNVNSETVIKDILKERKTTLIHNNNIVLNVADFLTEILYDDSIYYLMLMSGNKEFLDGDKEEILHCIGVALLNQPVVATRRIQDTITLYI